MRKTMLGAGAALAAALAGCGPQGTDTANDTNAANAQATEHRIDTMPEGQRNAVFIRAIRDAGEQCQYVESSERITDQQGLPVWSARCSDGERWTIVIADDGTAAVSRAATVPPAGNEAATQNAQEK
jgi:hypothetical protein